MHSLRVASRVTGKPLKKYFSRSQLLAISCEVVYLRKGDDHTERSVLKLIRSLHAYRSRILDRFFHSRCL